MKKTVLTLFVTLASTLSFSSCDIFKDAAQQVTSLANLANCEYSLKNVSNLTIGGVDIKGLKNGNISAGDIINLTSALVSKKVPMAMDVNVDVKNPTSNNAALTALDWIMDIDNTQFATGTNTNSYSIPSNTTTAIPLNVNTDLYSMFSSNGIESLKTFVKSFSNDGTSSKVGLRIKPSLNVGGVKIQSPSYIKLEKKTGTSAS